ncbi:copper resistance protein NlpE N-terminal domain-containing protein [Acinetobacter bereziniae]|uniref:copper resistance protein NlpE N-terminal domain-containing protein n=1 Tax=Acinetobacter bereziniae TaxID=106648 RepID=UPI00190168BE|nr:copper resistance protein NlpE N-terminal domain-containing protein [Acinetobacter bereziniae]MBJ8451829.1 copper resistance protein NlpE N-terminal domain-containing protein [Acinetobacter bereziniae]MBJ8456019.1 copper resistance protein NlpE N-terminal domain-containing protein [Acinetobacter bereziniae]
MKKRLLSSFIFASVMMGCGQHEQALKDEKASSEVKKPLDVQLQKWVGHYKGTLPCAGCVTFCDECNGMTVDLKIYADQTFRLERTSNSDHNKHELYAGNFSFLDNGKVKIQLQSVKERNQLILGHSYVEVLETKTGLPYQFFEDFQLDKIA